MLRWPVIFIAVTLILEADKDLVGEEDSRRLDGSENAVEDSIVRRFQFTTSTRDCHDSNVSLSFSLPLSLCS